MQFSLDMSGKNCTLQCASPLPPEVPCRPQSPCSSPASPSLSYHSPPVLRWLFPNTTGY